MLDPVKLIKFALLGFIIQQATATSNLATTSQVTTTTTTLNQIQTKSSSQQVTNAQPVATSTPNSILSSISTTTGKPQHHPQQQDNVFTSVVHVNDCSMAACESGSTCHDRVGYFYCECPPGKIGLLCQLDDGCFHNPCHNNATCTSSTVDGIATCECPKGFTGVFCEQDIDECAAGSPCEHGGACVNTPGSFKCDCPRGFSGSRCEININECEKNPCMNEGTCLDERGDFKCICMPGFTGQHCQIDIDECASNPCQNGALCKDYVNSFRCLCQAGFWGERCELSHSSNLNQLNLNSLNNLNGNNCELNDCESKLQNGVCDEECNNLKCSFDGGDCLKPGNPWAKCGNPIACWVAFKNGECDPECNTPECLYDGDECSQQQFYRNPSSSSGSSISSSSSSSSSTSGNGASGGSANNNGSGNGRNNSNQHVVKKCDDRSDSYCLKNYANGVCDQECNTAECGWDGADCETAISNEIMPSAPSTLAQGLLVIRVEPAIEMGGRWDIELAQLLRKISLVTKTILKIQNFRQVDEGRGTEIELIADNRRCQHSCYNSTELIAKFLSALKERTKDFESSSLIRVQSFDSVPGFGPIQNSATAMYVVICAALIACTLVMVMTVGSKQKKVREKAITWFPEGFKPVLTSRNRDPTDRASKGRGVSTLQALGGNFFRGIKRRECTAAKEHQTDIDRCNGATTPNNGVIYHEPYDQYGEYGSTYNGTDTGTVIHADNQPSNEPMSPPVMPMNPINIEGPHGLTPLMVASMGTQFSKEPLGLVSYGTTCEMQGPTDSNVTDLLHRGAQVNLANKVTGETALHLAARHGRVDAARGLLERCDSQDVNAQDATGRTPLHAAIAADSMGVFELLIRCRGTDLNAQTHDGTTPLILATKVGTYSMLEELILNECEVTKSDANGKTALHWAAATNNVDAIRRLLAVRETNKDAQDLAEETPLFLAAKEGAKGAIEMLLSHNANKDISDEMDRSPIEIARLKQHYDIVRLLEEHEPPTPRSINSMHASSRQISPFSPATDGGSNSNGSSGPPPSYHSHTQSTGVKTPGGRQAQRAALARSNSTKPLIAEANIIRNNLQNHCKSVMVYQTDDFVDHNHNNTTHTGREVKTLGRRATKSTSSSHHTIQTHNNNNNNNNNHHLTSMSVYNVAMPPTPNSLTNSLSPVSSSMMSPPTSSFNHLNSPTHEVVELGSMADERKQTVYDQTAQQFGGFAFPPFCAQL